MTKNIFLLLAFLFLANCPLISQEVHDDFDKTDERITVDGNKYYQHDMQLSYNQLLSVISSNAQARPLAKSAKSNMGLANVFGFAGGFLVGWPLGTAMGGGEPNWGLAGAGAGLILVAIPITSSANKKMKKAVEIYNEDLEAPEEEKLITSLKFTGTRHGVGLVLRF